MCKHFFNSNSYSNSFFFINTSIISSFNVSVETVTSLKGNWILMFSVFFPGCDVLSSIDSKPCHYIWFITRSDLFSSATTNLFSLLKVSMDDPWVVASFCFRFLFFNGFLMFGIGQTTFKFFSRFFSILNFSITTEIISCFKDQFPNLRFLFWWNIWYKINGSYACVGVLMVWEGPEP